MSHSNTLKVFQISKLVGWVDFPDSVYVSLYVSDQHDSYIPNDGNSNFHFAEYDIIDGSLIVNHMVYSTVKVIRSVVHSAFFR